LLPAKSAREAELTSMANDGDEFATREKERKSRVVDRIDDIAALREETTRFRGYYQDQIKRLISSLVTPRGSLLEVGCGLGDLLAELRSDRRVGIDLSPKMIAAAKRRHPELELHLADAAAVDLPSKLGAPFDTILLTDVVGLLDDVQLAFERLTPLLAPGGRVIVTYYSFGWAPLLKLGELLGMKTSWPEQNWLSMVDIENLLSLADLEVVRRGTDVLVPADVPLVASVANRVAAKLPVVKEASLVSYFVARYQPRTLPAELPSVSVISACRNERGNIEAVISRTPVMGSHTELIFVDGNSEDGTQAEIEAQIRAYKGPLSIRLIHQGDGKGKGDAVRRGFAAAKNDVFMILDTDLTVPPEDLPKFYRALVTEKGDFINGVRLVYPMEGQAMRFLNLVGNKFFSVALSWLLEQPIKDSLCGTKVLRREAYQKIADNRAYFGEFDPFGDFDLLFGAARLNLKIIDLPVRYRARTYGDTKISRFSSGWLLLKMTAFGFRKLRMGD